MDRKLPNLLDKLPVEVSRELRLVFNHVYDLIAQNQVTAEKALARPAFEGTVREQAINEAVGLLGAFAQPLAGDTSTDNQLDSLGTSSSSVTSVSGGSTGYSFTSTTTPVMSLSNAATVRTSLSIDEIATKKSNLRAVVAPTVNDDEGGGYDVGSVWVNSALGDVYMCVDPTLTAAVWKKLN